VKNLAQLFDTHDLGKTLAGVAIASIGPVTTAAAGEFGLRVDIQPQASTSADLARCIAEHF
jgi:uroporphyrinogen-III synthase